MITIIDKKTEYSKALAENGAYQLDKLCISAETTEDIYGNYELNISIELLGDVPTNIYDMLEVDNIIKVLDEDTEELFRIAQVEKGLDEINLYCRHITIADSLNLWLGNVKPTNLDGAATMLYLAKATEPKCNLILRSNITDQHTADYVRKNLHEALFEGDNGFINRWGGEVKRTGYEIRINNKIGTDKTNDIIIKESLNLKEFNAKTNIDDLCTVIYPIAFDGIEGDRVQSELINNYSMEFPKQIKYEDVKLRKVDEQGNVTQEGLESKQAVKEEIKRRAELEFTENNIDKIQLECDIDYIDLDKFDEYKNISALQKANLGDYVKVRVNTFDMDLVVRIVSRKYDVLRQQRIENTISTDGKLKGPEPIDKIIKDMVEKVEAEGFKDLSGYIDSMIQNGFVNGHIVIEQNAIYAVNKLPKESAEHIVVLNKNGLGYSNDGGANYTYGFTIDGKLNADMITTGSMILKASGITIGIIMA